jgi:asparagine synthase (glutamine-hydrolysing)
VSAIAGLWRFDGQPSVDTDCVRMRRALEIYGPHDGRTWSEGALAMGRRLYRILPEDAHDRQPLSSRDGRLTLVADVRLDNRDELTRALGLPLGEARQLCDAAILLESLERWGEGALDRLAGDFAFALWDARAQKLTLARDFLGKRPLHYHRAPGLFAFASMPSGLHALAEIPKAPDEQVMAEFLALMPERSGHCFYAGIERVDAGTVVTVTHNGLAKRRYWEPRRPAGGRLSPGDYVDGLRHHFDQAVRAQLRGAQGAVATHLSAGYDSGAITTTAARLLAPSGGKVVAFTSVPREGYDRPAPRNRFTDEGALAAATAAMYPNIEHVLVRSQGASPLAEFDRIAFLLQRPFLNPSNFVWMQAIDKAAQERKLTVLLAGQGGNMTISYSGLHLLPELLRTGRLIRLWREASALVAKTEMRWRGALVSIFGPFMPQWLWLWLNESFGGGRHHILEYSALSAAGLAHFDLAARARERDLDFTYRPWADGFAMRLWVLRRQEMAPFHKGMLAASGVDRRDPASEKRLVEFCLSVPTDQYLVNGELRALAKRALADRLPQAVLNEARKGYQSADWHEGLVAAVPEIKAELDSLSECAPAARMLDIERMKRSIANLPEDGWERQKVQQTYKLALMRGLAAGHFLRKASGANR